MTIINTLSTDYNKAIMLPQNCFGHEIVDEKGTRLHQQHQNKNTIISLNLKPFEVRTLSIGKEIIPDDIPVQKKEFVLDNDLIRYEFDNQGLISRIFDKQLERDFLADNGSGNLISCYEDRPVNWDAWDIDIYYENQLREHSQLKHREWIADGPVRSGFRQESRVGRSTIVQEIYLDNNSKRLDFETQIDWQENHKMLRVSFAVSVVSDFASYEIQFGHIRRNTHRNTSWDMAKFEVVGHRYADLSDNACGIALLNDCKYGYKIHENVIDLNLLRSPSMPDPDADRGSHEFTYSLLPHKEVMIHSGVISEAAQLNQPPLVFSGMDGQKIKIPFVPESDRIILDTIKKAERDNTIILRLYEPRGIKTSSTLKFKRVPLKVFESDLMEKDISELSVKKGELQLRFAPFEIKTLKIQY